MIILALAVIVAALAVKYVDYRFREFKSSIAPVPSVQRPPLTPAEIDELNRQAVERMGGVKPPSSPQELARMQAVMEETSKDIPPLTDARRAELEQEYKNRFTTP